MKVSLKAETKLSNQWQLELVITWVKPVDLTTCMLLLKFNSIESVDRLDDAFKISDLRRIRLIAHEQNQPQHNIMHSISTDKSKWDENLNDCVKKTTTLSTMLLILQDGRELQLQNRFLYLYRYHDEIEFSTKKKKTYLLLSDSV